MMNKLGDTIILLSVLAVIGMFYYVLKENRIQLQANPIPTKVYTEHKPTTCFPLYGLEDDNEWYICMGVPIK